jgi:hypothetical protein
MGQGSQSEAAVAESDSFFLFAEYLVSGFDDLAIPLRDRLSACFFDALGAN